MLTWLSANLVNIVLIAVIVLVVTLLIRSMIRDKRAGKSSCGCSCADCGGCSAYGSRRLTADRSNAVPCSVSK